MQLHRGFVVHQAALDDRDELEESRLQDGDVRSDHVAEELERFDAKRRYFRFSPDPAAAAASAAASAIVRIDDGEAVMRQPRDGRSGG